MRGLRKFDPTLLIIAHLGYFSERELHGVALLANNGRVFYVEMYGLNGILVMGCIFLKNWLHISVPDWSKGHEFGYNLIYMGILAGKFDV